MSAILDLRREARALRPALPHLPHLVDAAIATWHGRMVNEYASASVFAALAEQLEPAGLSDLRAEVLAFADEERRHGALCGAVVEALGGTACAELPTAPDLPAHDDAATRLEAVLRNVLSICCLSETIAVALIGAERFEMPDGELRSLLTRIWADEIGHARFGWRLLARVAPTLSTTTQHALGDYLAVAFAHLEAHELAHLPLASRPPADGSIYGLCDGADARRLFFATVADVVVPGLVAHGLPAADAWRNRARTPDPSDRGTSTPGA